jgi:hypothetical protein
MTVKEITHKKLLLIPIKLNKDRLDIPRCYHSVMFVFDTEDLLLEFIEQLGVFQKGEIIPITDIAIESDLTEDQILPNNGKPDKFVS